MSGHKRATVTISQEEYRRLYDAERTNAYSTIDLPLNNYQEISQQSAERLLLEVDNLSQRQDKYLNSIRKLNVQIQDLEYKASKSLVDQQLDFYNQLSQNSNEIWKNAEDFIETQSREINQQVIVQHDQLQQQIVQLEKKLTKQSKDKQAVCDAAVEWINNGLAVHDFIKSTYHLNQQNADEFTSYENQLKIALANFENHFFEASLSTAQQVFSLLTRFRLKVERDETERSQLLLAINHQCQIILEKISLNQNCYAIDIHGNLLDEKLFIDHWVDGKLGLLQSEVIEFRNYIDATSDQLTLDELRTYLGFYFQEKNQQIEDLIMDARYYALNSQLRYTIAQQVMLSLVEQGFRPVEGGFLENNYNGQYLARAINHDGGEVTITVDPDEKIPLKNEIHIHSKGEQVLTVHELKQRSDEIRSSLIKNGLEVSQPMEVSSPGNNQNSTRRSHKESRNLTKLSH